MSWLARSIANSLNFNDEDDDKTTTAAAADSPEAPHSPPSPKGVKEDLTELTQTFTRQLWGVASFLAPPPPSDPNASSKPSDAEEDDEELISGIRSDLSELGGKFKSGISKLSKNVHVSEFTKFASSFMKFDDGDVVGVTEDVVGFVDDVVSHPETWLDFPVPDEDDDHDRGFDGFDMSDAQQKHALAVERLIPKLAALRMELCPGYMSENCFWKIYFVLLHPRLSKHDAELLSTPEILEARFMLTNEVQNRSRTNPELIPKETVESLHGQYLSAIETAPSGSVPVKSSPAEVAPINSQAASEPDEPASGETTLFTKTDVQADKHPVESSEIQIIDKPVIDEQPTNGSQMEQSKSGSFSKVFDDKYEDDGDDWLKEENSEIVGISGSPVPVVDDEDVSFSDLEDDDEDEPKNYKKITSGSDSSTKDSRDWVQLGRSSTDSARDINIVGIRHVGSEQVRAHNHDSKESSDWLNVDDTDVM